MSEQIARSALERMNLREVAVAPFYGGLAADLRSLASADATKAHQDFLSRRGDLCVAYCQSAQVQDKPFAFAAGLAFIPVQGSLINRFGGSWGFVTGYNFIRSQVAAAVADPDVKGIVFDMNSNGGEAAGCFELSAELAACQKPTLGVIDSNCYSACYAIGSALDTLVAIPSAGAGSIGVVSMHVSYQDMLAEAGIKVTYIYSGEHKVDGNPYQDLPDDVRANIQASVNKSRKSFCELVAANRGLDVQAVMDTEARCYRAEDALSLGLIDAIATPTEAVRAFLSELSGSSVPTVKGSAMSAPNESGAQPNAQVDLAKAQADARVAERARVSGILNCDAAKGRESLAQHLAMNTDLSVEAATAILGAAPAPQAAAAPATAANPFAVAMSATTNPNIGADAGSAGSGEQLSQSQQILRDYALATGRKVTA